MVIHYLVALNGQQPRFNKNSHVNYDQSILLEQPFLVSLIWQFFLLIVPVEPVEFEPQPFSFVQLKENY